MEREAPKRRRRPAVSCILCRQRKIRCNRESPCNNCLRSKNAECVYRDTSKADLPPPAKANNHSGQPSPPRDQKLTEKSTSSTDSFTNKTHSDLGFHHDASAAFLNAPASGTSASSPSSHFEVTSNAVAGTFHFQHQSTQIGLHQPATSRSASHKTRLFGQSHWINAVALLRDMFDVLEPHMVDESSKAFNGLKRCKQLAKTIKQHRAPPWPCLPTSELPVKSVADQLVECYLRTVEPFYRILHIPSFRNDYEALWSSPTVTPDTSFLIQVKLVLAIGAATYDSTFSLRAQALRWVYEAQTFLSAPDFKHRLGIQFIQSNCLLMFAREATGVGEDMIWTSIGSLVRTAMYMGLHRGSANLPPTMTLLAKETRLRLWNTILELVVHSSMVSGGDPLVDLDIFDTEAPGNFDDHELTNVDASSAGNEGRFTQTSVAIALRKTLPQRLAIAKFLNAIGSNGTYKETLKLDTELRAAYKDLTRNLQASKLSSFGPSELELRSLDLMMRRYFLSLHLPFFGPSLQEASFAFSRKVAVESALRFWRSAHPVPLSLGGGPASQTGQVDLLSRQVTNSSGVFRTAGVQAFIVIACELKALIKEEDSLGPVSLRPDLLAVLEDAKIWTWDSIAAGETNTKAYLFVQMACSQVKALMDGREEGEVSQVVVTTAEESEARCQAFFEDVIGGLQGMIDGAASDMMVSMTVTPEFGMGDWDYMAPDIFQPIFSEPMNWSFW
ncbi:hypothetical protein QBC43DRAFT_314364 [Cladorrhinum sp. PSN259]|nr:hypothetical protein QBC43DRAFT_314364 [Cladorrhinum sp. PSN259]